MTLQLSVDLIDYPHYETAYVRAPQLVRPALFEQPRCSGLRLPPVARRAARPAQPDAPALYATLGDFVQLAQRLREPAAR